jgi:ATP-dependent Clp protease ATP-binding subunit ClpA
LNILASRYRELKETIPIVTEDDITDVVSSWTNIPVKKLSEDETKRLLENAPYIPLANELAKLSY